MPSREKSLKIRYPWWIHPAWALALLSGSMAIVAIVTPAVGYETWGVPKYLDGDLSLALLILLMVFFVGIMVASGSAARGGEVEIGFTETHIAYCERAFRVLFALSLLGYVIWFASAAAQGVSVRNLEAVLNRELGALSAIKESARPIGGVTTLTQFGPVAVAIGFVLRRIGVGSRWYLLLLPLAAVRMLFYAERLALIEVILPIIILAALTIDPSNRAAKLVRVAPILVAPLIWGLFASLEYTRSWVYYQQVLSIPFHEWVTLRLVGYYTTSYNNSALLAQPREGLPTLPYFTFEGLWNAPVSPEHPGMEGMAPRDWWVYTLEGNASPEFNNTGSFLVTLAELEWLGALVFWALLGLAVGAVYARMSKGSLPAVLAVSTLFVGLLELPRFLYWTQGRSVPVLLGVIVIALTYPKVGASAHSVRSTRASRS